MEAQTWARPRNVEGGGVGEEPLGGNTQKERGAALPSGARGAGRGWSGISSGLWTAI